LTKPLGTGLITTALKKGKAAAEHVQAAVSAMVQLNKTAAEISLDFHVDAITDITGFGLAGHAAEVAKASHISIEFDHRLLPLLPGTLDYSRAGLCAGGLASNREFFCKLAAISDAVSAEMENVFFDPQTSPGTGSRLSAYKNALCYLRCPGRPVIPTAGTVLSKAPVERRHNLRDLSSAGTP